jgi:membrane protein implicated in regulation of membrane protease activity
MCHILLFFSVIALALFFFVPAGQAAFLSLPVFLILLWLSWLTWRDMRRQATTGIEGMIGGKAQVISKTEAGAKVLLKGELWNVVSGDDLSVGETVQVIGLERMKLVVEREE